mgnify:FL=1
MMYVELKKLGKGPVEKANTRGGRMRLYARNNNQNDNASPECVTVVDGAVLRGKERLEALLQKELKNMAQREEAENERNVEEEILGYNTFIVFGREWHGA